MKSHCNIKRASKARRLRSTALFFSPIFTSLALASTAYAQPASPITFNIPAGSLPNAIKAFEQQTGLRISYPERLAVGKQSAGISGQVSASQALDSILEGSGLSYRYSDANTVLISDSGVGSASGAAVSNSDRSQNRVSSSTVRTASAARSTTAASPLSDKVGDHPTLDTITIKGQIELDPADEPYRTAGSSAYLSSEHIERFRGTSVGDFLSGIPGVMNADGRNSGAVDVNIRGMQGQGRVPVLVDGATQETTVYQGYNGATARTYIDPDFISSVSIEKGISSAPDAVGATGGVVRASIIGVDDILLPGKSYGIRLKAGLTTNSSSVPEVGTNGGWKGRLRLWSSGEPPAAPTRFYSSGMRRPALLETTGGSGSAVIAATSDYIDFVAGYVQRKNGNYHAGKHGSGSAHLRVEPGEFNALWMTNKGLSAYRAGEEILNTSSDSSSWLLKAILKPAPEHALELAAMQYDSDYGTAFGTRLEAGPYQNSLSDITLDTYTAKYRWKPRDNDFIDLKINAYQTVVDNRINTVEQVHIPFYLESGGIRYERRIVPMVEWMGSTRRGLTVSNTSLFAAPVGKVKLQYGGAFVRENVGLPAGVDVEQHVRTFNDGYPREGWRKEASGFSSLEWKPSDYLTLDFSTRYAKYRTLDKFRTYSRPLKRHDGGWSSKAGLMFEPSKGLQIYTKYGVATRAPSIFEALKGASMYLPLDENPFTLERARNFELGLNYLKDNAFVQNDKFRLHFAYFHNHIDDYLTRVGVKSERPAGSGNFVEILGRANLDYAEMRGLEASARYDTGRHYANLAWNHYTHIMFCARKGVLLDTEPICSAGGLPHSYSLQQVPPKNTVTLDLGTRLMHKKLAIGSRVSYIGSRFAPGISKNIGVSGVQASNWRPYTLIDVYSSYKLNKHVSFDLTIDNVTDRYYMDAINAALMPAPGRTVRGVATIKF
ncbi:TonB-dependent receptor domain-containing protein [Allopusillimonas ginsengisoli]|uniref:TonB-dependent receptor n=1 Tax=Allopusillimonas ginsengisoli TaxID=453575 RepID=UPI0039C3FC66